MTPFIGEIRLFGGNFAPFGWALCQGQLLPISEYSPLFALIGTTYGGDGITNFALPDLRGRFPVHQGTGAGQTTLLGETGGTETVSLNASQLPMHTHTISASSTATSQSPSNAMPAAWSQSQYSTADPTATQMSSAAVTPAGGLGPHENRSPYLGVSFIIALQGIFPSQG